MASERKAQRTTATVERRPVSSAVAQRSAAPAPVRVNVAAPVSPQLSQARRLPTSVSKPTDPAEREVRRPRAR